MPDLSVTHQEPPREETERPYSRVIEELLKYHIRWWGDSRLEAWPFYQRAGGPLSNHAPGFTRNTTSRSRKMAGDHPPP